MNHGGRYRLWTFLVILAALATYLAGGGSVHLWDRDEAWYAQSSKQMVESGNWVVTYFLDQPRFSKPIFVYWCQALCMKVLGPTERAARLPSAIAMTITLAILAVSIGRTLGARRAFYTVLVFASSVMVIASAKMCLTDSVLLTFLTTAQLCLFAIYWRGRSRASVIAGPDCARPSPQSRPAITLAPLTPAPETVSTPETVSGSVFSGPHIAAWLPVVFWLAVAFAGLTKGPIVLAVLLASLIALACLEVGGQWRSFAAWKSAVRWWRELRPLLGILIIAAVVAPWLVAAYFRDPVHVKNMFLEPLRHTTSNQDGQWILPGYYLVAIWPTFFPWCVLLPPALYHAWCRRRAAHIRFVLAIVLGNWLLAEVMVTKLPHYLLPSFAALAFLTADCLIHGLRRPFVRFVMPGTLLWAVGAAGLAAAPLLLDRMFEGPPTMGLLMFCVVAFAYIGVVATLLVRDRLSSAASAMGLGMLLIALVLYAAVLPAAWYMRLPINIAQQLRRLGATQRGDVIMTGYFEPSLAFYQGGTIRERPRDYLARTPPADWPHWIVTTREIVQALDHEKAKHLLARGGCQGLNYNAAAKSDLYSRVSTTRPAYSTIASRDGNEYKSLIRIETVLILEKIDP